MYGVMNDSAGGPGNRFLTTVDVGTGAVTIIGPTAPDLDAIAFPVFVPVELQSFSVE